MNADEERRLPSAGGTRREMPSGTVESKSRIKFIAGIIFIVVVVTVVSKLIGLW